MSEAGEKMILKRLEVGSFLILLVLGVRNAHSESLDFAKATSSRVSCARGRPSKEWFPFLGLQTLTGSRQVTIMVDDKAREHLDKSPIEAAIKEWHKACSQEVHIPVLVIDWKSERPPFDDKIGRTTLYINFEPDEEPYPDPQQGKKARVAEWFSSDNSIRIFGKCGYRKMNMPCDTVRGSIKWNSPWGAMVIAHEIGHALGLDHDRNDCEEHGLMQETADKEIIRSVIHDYCCLADAINDDKAPCNNATDRAKTDGNPCEDLGGDGSVAGRP